MRAHLLSWAFSCSATLGMAECDRTPAEDFSRYGAGPRAGQAAVLTPAADAQQPGRAESSGRCVTPTPATPPPAVSGPAPDCPEDPEGALAPSRRAPVSFANVGGLTVDAEYVRNEHDTMRGLMYRTTMREGEGMLFDLRVRDDHKFWMHNTCIPLDMLFVDSDGLIVGIVENVPTLNDESRGVGCPSRWVLEVNAGWARRHGVKAGQRVTFPAVDGQ